MNLLCASERRQTCLSKAKEINSAMQLLSDGCSLGLALIQLFLRFTTWTRAFCCDIIRYYVLSLLIIGEIALKLVTIQYNICDIYMYLS